MSWTGRHVAARLIRDYAARLDVLSFPDDAPATPANEWLRARAWTFDNYVKSFLDAYVAWYETSREQANFTYHLTAHNELQLAGFVDAVAGCGLAAAQGYVAELGADRALVEHVNRATLASPQRDYADLDCGYGRRAGWYALVRALRPRLVVETGVEKGLGSCVLAAALLRNAADGSPGRYVGTDIDPGAGCLFVAPYSAVGQVLYGDSLASLARLDGPIDLFINDSDHSEAYEAREYAAVHDKLAPAAVVLGDNSHASPALFEYARTHGKTYLFFAEQPRGHFYPGAGIGICFARRP